MRKLSTKHRTGWCCCLSLDVTVFEGQEGLETTSSHHLRLVLFFERSSFVSNATYFVCLMDDWGLKGFISDLDVGGFILP